MEDKMKISVVSGANSEYDEVICSLIEREFPGSIQDGGCAAFEAVVSQIVGTKQSRFGPTPSPEVLVTIRDAVRRSMEAQVPIHVLIPWGASKQGNYGIDLAEVFALKQIKKLVDGVSAHYKPGIRATIRVEDLTDQLLFGENYKHKVVAYTHELAKLALIIGGSAVYSETELVQITGNSPKFFMDEVNSKSDKLYQAIKHGNEHGCVDALSEIGWTGGLPLAQMEYYQKVYSRLYPSRSDHWRNDKIATYFAASLVRRQMGATGGGATSVILCFAKPVPAANQDRRVYYRTLPERYQNTHYSPWLAKGFVRIRGREAAPAIVGWDEERNFRHQTLTLSSGSVSASVEADYEVQE